MQKPLKLVPLRNFIWDRLYAPGGYFCKSDHQLGVLKAPLKFHQYTGHFDYQNNLQNNYPQFAFLTPVEIFQPYYGHTIANYILQHSQKSAQQVYSEGINILEIGAGTGTSVLNILDFFKRNALKIYDTINYTIVEVSPQLSKICNQRLSKEHTQLYQNKQVKIINKPIEQVFQMSKKKTFVIALEIMDNTPHDRIFMTNKQWTHQSMVDIEQMIEEKHPISDELIKECLEIYQSMPQHNEMESAQKQGFLFTVFSYLLTPNQKKLDNMYLPTGWLQIIKHLNEILPKAEFIFADFDNFYNQSLLKGINAPIVSKKLEKSHEKHDFDTYLIPRGEADILFPTNFRLLQHMIYQVTKKISKVHKTKDFIVKYTKQEWAETKSGYKPMKEDFLNTSILVT